MSKQPNELDEIKSILRTVAEQQASLQKQQERSQHQIDELREILQTSIPDLTEMVGIVMNNMDEHMSEMRASTTAFQATIASDRADRDAERLAETRARNEYRADMRGLQNESRNLLRELAQIRRQNTDK